MTIEALELEIEARERVSCRPFLKWVGGKSQLLPALTHRMPTTYRRYFEPFIGGGALFFHLQPVPATLSDINPELINLYTVVRDDVMSLIRELKKHRYEKEYFYQVRDVDRGALFKKWSPVRRASRFIFLNKTCFNGLYRVNSKGQFNVPFGSYVNPRILDAENLKACSEALQNVELRVQGFEALDSEVAANDFVYFDPPYVPLSTSSNFAGYYKAGFDLTMQERLFELCVKLDKRGAKFMLSNSSAPYVKQLYRPFNVQLISASRSVNSKGSGRGKVAEVLVTNY